MTEAGDTISPVTPEQQAVATANEAFYDALTNRDLPAMERLWFPADWAECVHPGGVALRSWGEVRDGWALLFTGASSVMVAATDVRVHLVGDIAWVSCTERLASTIDGRMTTSAAHATNIFVQHDGEWRMVLHHASPVPFVAPPDSGGLVN
jgi:ketosteroid isomerase-like protein